MFWILLVLYLIGSLPVARELDANLDGNLLPAAARTRRGADAAYGPGSTDAQHRVRADNVELYEELDTLSNQQ